MTIPVKAHRDFAEAIEAGDVAVVDRLLEQWPELLAHPEWVPPPVHCAVLWNQPIVLASLLDHGADIEQRDPDRRTTPLRYAIVYARVDVLPLLLDRGAYTGPDGEEGLTALQLAVDAAGGRFEEYDDLPDRDAYAAVVVLLRQFGAE